MDFKKILEDNFATYAGMTIQQRALIDARDGLKPSARQGVYAQYKEKILPTKGYQKAMKSVAAAMSRYYVHGDKSIYDLLMRLGKPFASRYLLEDIQGAYGNLMESNNHGAARYVEMRLSPLSMAMFENIEKDTIETWFNNYDDTDQFPGVLPTLGYYNIVNGTKGIATGLASSIPQFNLREVNNALITLLWNPDATFEDIYCIPDFATGAQLINEEEVKQSLKAGTGKACKLRSVIEFDPVKNQLIVTELPYSVYTNTICKQLVKLMENEEIDSGIESFVDLTNENPLIKITLKKRAIPSAVLKLLYKETSLQYHYGINMTMLYQGHTPKVFSWKEALQTHLDHEIEVLTKTYQFDLMKLKDRKHILEGYLIAFDHIDEIVKTIKSSSSKAAARKKLIEQFDLSERQAEAILEMKLHRLANLEIQKIKRELEKVLEGIQEIEKILNSKELLYKKIEERLVSVAKRFGDDRRTSVISLPSDDDDVPIEEKNLMLSLTNFGNVFVSESSTLYSQKRGAGGQKFRLDAEEYIVDTVVDTNQGMGVFFSDKGKFFAYNLCDLPLNKKTNVAEFLQISMSEKVTRVVAFSRVNMQKNIIFITKKGMVKKTLLSEYNTRRKSGIQALKLKEGDEIISILFTDSDKILISSKAGKSFVFQTSNINPIGRIATGVKGMALDMYDEVVSAELVKPHHKEVICATENGKIKRLSLSEISVSNRGAKGSKAIKLASGDSVVGLLPIAQEDNVIIISKNSKIKLKAKDISIQTKLGMGVKASKRDINIVGIFPDNKNLKN